MLYHALSWHQSRSSCYSNKACCDKLECFREAHGSCVVYLIMKSSPIPTLPYLEPYKGIVMHMYMDMDKDGPLEYFLILVHIVYGVFPLNCNKLMQTCTMAKTPHYSFTILISILNWSFTSIANDSVQNRYLNSKGIMWCLAITLRLFALILLQPVRPKYIFIGTW